jgi:hypothetical protein
MGCKTCEQQFREKAKYENIKNLAKAYAKDTGEIVFIYRTVEGYNFATLDHLQEFNPTEFVSPMQ